MLGVEDEDKDFFEQALTTASLEVQFLPVGTDIAAIDTEVEVVSVFVNMLVTRSMIEHLPQLKLIATRSTGVNHIDLDAAKEHGVTVANVPGYGGSTVAEYAVTLLLMLTRQMRAVLDESNSTDPSRAHERGIDLYGRTMGIIGTGNIGRGVAKIAKGFGMRVLGYDMYPNQQEAETIGFEYVELDKLLTESDVISLHIPSSPENTHLINAETLTRLKDGVTLINTARGELIDTVALVEALETGKVGAAGLDVLEDEQLLNPNVFVKTVAEQKDESMLRREAALAVLQKMPNVLITNHNAFNTQGAVQIINQTTIDNIVGFFSGKSVHTV